MYSLSGAFIVSFFFLNIIRDKNAFFNYSAKIEVLFIISLASTFSPVRAADRFSVIFSASAKSLA
jgi:hypothetical protein